MTARIVPELESYFGLCFEDLCRQALPALYLREGVVGVRKDGVIDLSECKWGPVRSKRALADELETKVRSYPVDPGATVVRHAFTRRRPRGRADGHVVWHTLEDLYAAFDS